MSRRRRRITRTRRMENRGARLKILAAANAVRRADVLPTLRMKNLNEAVCIVRRRRLVKDSVLAAAGFNPSRYRVAAQEGAAQ